MTFWLLASRRIHLPERCVGLQLHFVDGSASKVYRETVVDRPATTDPAVLLVGFRLRAVRGQAAHALFRCESLFNTPLFVGFPGLVSKLWVAPTIQTTSTEGTMSRRARCSPRTTCGPLWCVLALVCVLRSIHYEIVPGLTRKDC